MEKIDFRKQRIPFTQVANVVLYDPRLSLGAKAVYAFMYSKPDGWHFSALRIGQELHVNKRTILGCLKELKESGYLYAKKQKSGRMLYQILLSPEKPECRKCTLGTTKAKVQNLHRAESAPISNKEVKVINNNNIPAKADKIMKYREKEIDYETREEVKDPLDNLGGKMQDLLHWAENREGRKFLNIKKQYTAMKKMREAGIQPAEIKQRWIELASEDFHKKVGLDFMMVCSSFDKKR